VVLYPFVAITPDSPIRGRQLRGEISEVPRRRSPPQKVLEIFAKERAKRAVGGLLGFIVVTGLWLVPLLIALGGDVRPLGAFVGAVNQAGLFSPPELSIVVPLLCILGGVVLRKDARVRWLLLSGTALFLTQYPRMDTLHLAWSAPLLLVVGAVVLDRLRLRWAIVVLVGLAALSMPIVTSRLDVMRMPRAPVADVEAAVATAQELNGVIADIQSRTQPGEPIFVYPTSPLLYVLADRPNPTRFDHLNPGAASPPQIDQVIADLDHAHLKLVVISDFWQANWGPPGPNAVLETWLNEHFSREVARHGAYRVLAASL
jgi:hypothetical protein